MGPLLLKTCQLSNVLDWITCNTSLAIHKRPTVFYKPRTCIADHNEAIPIPKVAQNNQCDYEGELCVVIGKTGVEIKEEDSLSYVAGYVAGDDVPARTWQI